MSEPSPFTCAKCGKIAMWEEIEREARISDMRPGGRVLSGGVDWWLNVPCECGSQLFKVKCDVSTWRGVVGTNGN